MLLAHRSHTSPDGDNPGEKLMKMTFMIITMRTIMIFIRMIFMIMMKSWLMMMMVMTTAAGSYSLGSGIRSQFAWWQLLLLTLLTVKNVITLSSLYHKDCQNYHHFIINSIIFVGWRLPERISFLDWKIYSL